VAADAAPRRDLERFVGVAVLGRVGIAALLLAAGYFAQWTYGRIPPVARVVSIYGLAGLLIGVGAFLRGRVAPTFLGILWGGGAAAAYLAGVAARLRYGLVDPTTALAMLAGASALGDLLARRAKLQGLAIVAIAGAGLAPLLVAGGTDSRTGLLVYLLAVYAWGVFVARRRGWTVAWGVGFLATVAVAALWFETYGRADASTWTHVHLYLLGWSLPVCATAMRAGGLKPFHARLVGALLLVAECLLTFWGVGSTEALARGFVPAMGLVWAGVALAVRRRGGPDGVLHRGLARTSGMMLVFAAVFAFQGIPSAGVLARTGPLVALAALAVLALQSRRVFGVGDGIAFTAAVVAMGGTALGGLAEATAWRAVALVPALAVVVGGRSSAWRVAALIVAACAAGAVVPPRSIADGYVPLAGYAAAAFVAFVATARARRTPGPVGDGELATSAAILVAFAVGVWGVRALGTAWGAVSVPVANPATAVAALLLATCVGLLLLGRRAPALPALAVRVLQFATLAAFLAAVAREVHQATSTLAAADAGRTIDTLVDASVAGALALFGARRGSGAAKVGAGLTWLVLAVQVLFSLQLEGGAWTAAAQVLLVAFPPLLFLASRRGADVETEAVALVAVLASVALWVTAWAEGRFAGSALAGNARFVSGALLVAGCVAVRRRAPGARALLTTLAAVASVVVAVPEVLEATRGVEVLATRRALVSVYGAVHAAVLLGIGFWRRDRQLRWLALGGFGIVVAKVGFLDLASVSTPVRVLVTGCLGAILLAAAYAYARRTRDAMPEAGADGDLAAPERDAPDGNDPS